MKYAEFEKLISTPRLARFNTVCGNNTRKVIKLYKANIHLSDTFLGILGMFEVVLRNKIDDHYKTQFPSDHGSHEWLLAATMPGGFLTNKGCESSLKKVVTAYSKLGYRYNHDKLIAEHSFGFWKFMFANKQYQAGGSSLLRIFPLRPARTNASRIYSKLDKINDIRNRVAHHEPICFGINNTISTDYARGHYQHITDLLSWMNINPQELLYGLDGVLKRADKIDDI